MIVFQREGLKLNSELKDIINLGLVMIIVLTAMKIAFYKESILVIVRSSLSLFWILILPGFAIMHYWDDKLDFIEKLIIGAIVSAGATGILSYYLGLLGINIKYHVWIIPPLLIVIGIFLFFIKRKNHE